MITAEKMDDQTIFITSDFPMRDKDRIMSLAGTSFAYKLNGFTAPLTWAACRSLRGQFGDDLVVGSALNDWAGEELRTRINPSLALRNAWDAEGDADLYPFQRAGVKFLSYARRALLLDDMGTGKTVQTIRTMAELSRNGINPFPAIVVAPKNMTITWRKEIERWWPGVVAVVVKGSLKKRQEILESPAHVYIINYEGVRGHSRLAPYGSIALKHCKVCDPTVPDTAQYAQSRCERCDKDLNKIPWKTVVVDEAHRMKDPKAKQTRALWALRTKATENIFCLTGTAIANAPSDMWPALHMISKDEFPSRSAYIERYCQTAYNAFSAGVTVVGLRLDTKDEFFSIIDPRMRRMPKKAVLPFLPDKQYSIRYVEMTPKQDTAYKQMEKGLIAQIGDGIAVASNPLVQLTRMTQFASAYAELDENGQVKLSAPSNKVDALLDIIDEMQGASAVVFAQSRQLIELAAEALRKTDTTFTMIVGGQSTDDREQAKEEFQAGKKQIILCTIAAGGIGITLTKANTAIFMQRSWSMVENSQAEDRVHRIGAEIHDSVNIIDIVSAGTLEERQRIVLGTKLERLEEVMRDRATLLRVLGAKEL